MDQLVHNSRQSERSPARTPHVCPQARDQRTRYLSSNTQVCTNILSLILTNFKKKGDGHSIRPCGPLFFLDTVSILVLKQNGGVNVDMALCLLQ